MKKYAVLQKIGDFPAKVSREFDDPKDAEEYAKLMQRSEDYKHTEYFVAYDIKSVGEVVMRQGESK